MSYFPELHTYKKNKIKFALCLSYHAARADLKNAAGVETSDFARKSDLASLKLDVDTLDIYKLKCAKWFKKFVK